MTRSDGRTPWRALPFAYMGVLFGLSSIPGTPTGPDGGLHLLLTWIPATLQNLLHVPQFALLSWLWSRAGAAPRVAVAASATYAVAEEVYQLTVPGRYGSLTDLALDGVGILAGVALFRRGVGVSRPA